MKIVFVSVSGKPSCSDGYFTFRLTKPGVKKSLVPMPKENERIGNKNLRKKITTTYREVHHLEHGGKGVWTKRINPHFDSEPGADSSLKYGAVITVRSTQNNSVYDQILSWMLRPEPVKIKRKAKEIIGLSLKLPQNKPLGPFTLT